jgi:hypothetical protein
MTSMQAQILKSQVPIGPERVGAAASEGDRSDA